MSQVKSCSASCHFFKCAKNAFIYRRNGVWCKWTDDICNIAICTYAMCKKRRLLPKGVCGETVKRKTKDKKPEDVVGLTVKLRGKAFRKIGEREVF